MNYRLLFGVLVVGLILVVGYKVANREEPAWAGSGLTCLSERDSKRGIQSETKLTIFVNGVEETIPAHIGVDEYCLAEAHTLDTTGTITVVVLDPKRRITLNNFFSVWGQPLDREGYKLTMTVNGVANSSLGQLILKDGQHVVLTYARAESSETISTGYQDNVEPSQGVVPQKSDRAIRFE